MPDNLDEKACGESAVPGCAGKTMAVPAVLLALLLLFQTIPADSQVAGSISDPWVSRGGELRIRYASSLEPLNINLMHSWILYVETSEGIPVAGAELTVEGGMPEHDHGLPTRPRVTRYLGDGKYLLEGMRFHMPGDWEIQVTVDAPGKQDVVIISLTL